jgi:hypothetical protein
VIRHAGVLAFLLCACSHGTKDDREWSLDAPDETEADRVASCAAWQSSSARCKEIMVPAAERVRDDSDAPDARECHRLLTWFHWEKPPVHSALATAVARRCCPLEWDGGGGRELCAENFPPQDRLRMLMGDYVPPPTPGPASAPARHEEPRAPEPVPARRGASPLRFRP